jgi:hypothetical protein
MPPMRQIACCLTLLLTIALGSLAAPPLQAGPRPGGQRYSARSRAQDQIWLVSTRQLGIAESRLCTVPALGVWKYDVSGNAWKKSSLDAFLATDDPAVPTNIFVHGNWLTLGDSVEVGFVYYRHEAEQALSERPLRLVLWSWPSAQADRPLRDVRAKYGRTDTEAAYLAWFLGRIQPQVKVSLVGYSFGAPIITGALHEMATHGGALAAAPVSKVSREPYRAVLLAAAEDECVLGKQGEHCQALSQVDRLLNIKNPCDPALKWFRFVDRCARPEALGYHGAGRLTAAAAAKVRELDASPIVGKQHNWRPYLLSPSIIEATRPYVWFDDAASNVQAEISP